MYHNWYRLLPDDQLVDCDMIHRIPVRLNIGLQRDTLYNRQHCVLLLTCRRSGQNPRVPSLQLYGNLRILQMYHSLEC